MDINKTITLNKKDLVFEHFEDEVVIINLNTGIYYSLGGFAQTLWLLTDPVCNLSVALEFLEEELPKLEDNEQMEIAEFFTQLAEEGLVIISDHSPNQGNGKKSLHARLEKNVLDNGYSQPVFSKYSDQQELLLLDPIHEVDDLGWPSKDLVPEDDR